MSSHLRVPFSFTRHKTVSKTSRNKTVTVKSDLNICFTGGWLRKLMKHLKTTFVCVLLILSTSQLFQVQPSAVQSFRLVHSEQLGPTSIGWT